MVYLIKRKKEVVPNFKSALLVVLLGFVAFVMFAFRIHGFDLTVAFLNALQFVPLFLCMALAGAVACKETKIPGIVSHKDLRKALKTIGIGLVFSLPLACLNSFNAYYMETQSV